MSKETSPPSHARLREARKAAGLTQEQAATLVGVVVRTLSGWEVSGTSERNVRHALTVYREHTARQKMPAKTSGRGVAEPGTGGLLVEGYAPRGVLSPARLSPEAVLKTRRVAQWLLDLRAELEGLGATERQAEHAADLTAQVLRSSSVGGAQSEWTVDDAIEAMKDEAETWRATFRRLDGQ